MNEITEEQAFKTLTYMKEIAWIQCDKITRETRILTKMLTMNDLKGGNMSKIDRRFFRALGDSSKVSEYLYPQLLETMLILNPPIIFKAVFAIAKMFMSKGFLDKVKVCKGDTRSQKIEKCPHAMQYMKFEDLPTFLGGTCECEGGCIGGVANSAVCREDVKVVSVEKTED